MPFVRLARSSMVCVATLVLLYLVAPSTSARYGAYRAYGASLPSANLAGRRGSSQPRYLALAQATPGRHGSQARRWTCSSGRSLQVSRFPRGGGCWNLAECVMYHRT